MNVTKNEWRDSGYDGKLELVRNAFARPRILYVRTEILVHDYAPAVRFALDAAGAGGDIDTCPDATPCRIDAERPCCGSRTATIVRRIPDVEILIDREAGWRVRREDMTPEAFEAVRAAAEEHYIPLRVSVGQLDLLLGEDAPQSAAPGAWRNRSTSRGLFASGGNRSGKTTVGLYWLCRQWLLRGGREKRFWLCAHTLPKAYRLWEKIFRGTGTSPAILPLALAGSYPDSARSSNLATRMCDGSIIDLKHFNDPSAENLKSDAIVAALCDEAAHLPSEDTFTALYNRTLDERGSIFLSSTPRPGHFIKGKIVDPCLDLARLRGLGEQVPRDHEGSLWTYRELSLFTNPWLDPIEVGIRVRSQGQDDPSVLRDVYGRWVANSGFLWREFSTDAHVLRNECRDLTEWNDSGALVNVTETASRRIFGRKDNPAYRGIRATNYRVIGGMDVNISPHSTVLVQVAGDTREPTNKDRWTVIVWDMLQTEKGDATVHAQALAGKRFAKMVRPGSGGDTYHGIGVIVDGTAIGRDPTAHRYGGNPRGLPEVFGKLGFDLRAPVYTDKAKPANPHKADSYLLLHRLFREGRLLIHGRCEALITALLSQEDSGDGCTPIKVSHNASDRLSSSVDALRYAAWAIFHGGSDSVATMSAPGMLR